MIVKCIIIEDEPLALARTRSFVQRLPYLDLIASFDNAIDALDYLRTYTVDLIFLDINLGDFSGISFLERAKIPCEVIITTAYDEYAIKGFELQVTDYLLKPFTFERFVQAVERAIRSLSKNKVETDRPFIFVKTEYRLEKIMLSEILFIEGMRDYRRVYTDTKQIMTLQTFKDFEREVSASIILRCHKSYMVGINRVESIERDRITIGQHLIPISETYKKHFLQQINSMTNK